MRSLSVLALLVLPAAPCCAQADPGAPTIAHKPVGRLYPEIDVSEESWRGLLPIILLNDETAEQPGTDGKRTGRN